jgi:hypothetical protein
MVAHGKSCRLRSEASPCTLQITARIPRHTVLKWPSTPYVCHFLSSLRISASVSLGDNPKLFPQRYTLGVPGVRNAALSSVGGMQNLSRKPASLSAASRRDAKAGENRSLPLATACANRSSMLEPSDILTICFGVIVSGNYRFYMAIRRSRHIARFQFTAVWLSSRCAQRQYSSRHAS